MFMCTLVAEIVPSVRGGFEGIIPSLCFPELWWRNSQHTGGHLNVLLLIHTLTAASYHDHL